MQKLRAQGEVPGRAGSEVRCEVGSDFGAPATKSPDHPEVWPSTLLLHEAFGIVVVLPPFLPVEPSVLLSRDCAGCSISRISLNAEIVTRYD